MNVQDIVLVYLEAHGYDGLFCADADCACRLGDLAPCGDLCGLCEPGYLAPGGEGGEEWRIVRKQTTAIADRRPCLPGCRRLTGRVDRDFCAECRRPVKASVEFVPGRGHLAVVSRAVADVLSPETPIEDARSGACYRLRAIERAVAGDLAVLVLDP